MAFVLLNRFLDIADMIEDSGTQADAALLDNSDFEETDVPYDKLCIPAKPCVASDLREQAKEWVLAVSLDQRVEQVLSIQLNHRVRTNKDTTLFIFLKATTDRRARSVRGLSHQLEETVRSSSNGVHLDWISGAEAEREIPRPRQRDEPRGLESLSSGGQEVARQPPAPRYRRVYREMV